MPPVFGPLSLSKSALWSCVGGSGTMVRPATRASTLNSSPIESLFDDDLPAGGAAELFADHDALNRGQGVLRGRADDHAFAGGQTVGLDDDWILARLDIVASRVGMVEDAELGRRHIGVTHQLLGERLAGLQLRRLLRWAEDTQARFVKGIGNALR